MSSKEPQAFDLALALLQHGNLVAFPTDTVYGLGAALNISDAIEQLYVVKGRDANKAIAVLVGNLDQLESVASGRNAFAELLARRFWPGPLTLVVPRRPELPENLSPLLTVGVRMPNHPDALTLLRRAGPLAVTSANLSGAPNARTAGEVFDQLGGRVPLVLDGGRTPGGLPSTVVDCTVDAPAILRAGPITIEQIKDALGSASG